MLSDEIIVKGPPGQQLFWNVSLGKLFYETLLKYEKDRVFLIDAHTKEQLTYGQLLDDSLVLAEILKEFGYGKDTVLSISSENNLQFYVPVLSSLFNGSILAPINSNYTSTELKHVLNLTKPLLIFCSSSVVSKFLDLKGDCKFVKEIIVIDSVEKVAGAHSLSVLLREKRARGCMRNFHPLNGDPAELRSFIMCSSGTTGLPKGVLLSHKNIMTNLLLSLDDRYPRASKSETVLGIMPFYHAYGLNVGLMTIFGGNKIVFLKRFIDDLFLKTIQDYRINVLLIAPPLAIFLSKSPKVDKYDLSSVERIGSGGAPMKKSTELEMRKRLKVDSVRQSYGLTESTLSVTLMPKDINREGSSGKLIPYMSCKVVDPTTNKSLGPNKTGEILLKGPNIMIGYYQDEAATKNAFTEDGWLRTGDLGYYDDEGFFYIVDRLKELIKYKGYQVAPAEVEAVLLSHSKIRDAAVVGLPDEQSGELPLAFIARNPGIELSKEEVQKYVKDKLSPQKWLRGGVRFIDEIPKNPSGKILRKELRNMLKNIKNKL